MVLYLIAQAFCLKMASIMNVDEDFPKLSAEEMIQLAIRAGFVREDRCQMACVTDKLQCNNIASEVADGIPCCHIHSNCTASDAVENPILCRFLFPEELLLRKEKKAVDLTPKGAQRRCHGKSIKANARCQSACVGDEKFCSVHIRKDAEDYPEEEWVEYCGMKTTTGSPCKNPRASGQTTCSVHGTPVSEVKVELGIQTPTKDSPATPTKEGLCNAITKKNTQCTRNGKHSHEGKIYCPQHFGILTK